MGVVARQTVKASIVSYIGVVIGYFNYLWIYPYALTAGEIGLYRTLLDISLLFLPFVQLGTDSIVVKFYPHFTDEKERYPNFFGYILLMPLVGFLLFLAAFMGFKDNLTDFFSEKSPLLIGYIYYIIPLIFLFVYVNVLESYSRVKLRIVVPKIIREILVRIFTMVFIVTYFFQYIDLPTLITLITSVYVLQLFMLLIYIFSLESVSLRPSISFHKDALFGEMTTYSLFMLLGRGGGIIVNRIDTIMTAALLGLMDTGVYSVAYFIGMVLDMPRRALIAILAPLVSKALKDDDVSLLDDYYKKSSLNQLIVGSVLFVLLWVNIDNIFHFVPKNEIYAAGKYVVFFIALSRLFNMAMGINNEIIINSKYYRWNIILMPFLAVIAIATNYYFIPKYGIVGTAIATVISIFLYNIIRLIFVYIKFGLQPFSFSTIQSLIIMITMFGVSYLIPFLHSNLVDFLVRSTVLLVFSISTTYYLKISSDANNLLDSLKKKYFG